MGKAIVSGGAIMTAPVTITETPMSDVAVGSVVKLKENGVLVDYIVVHIGRPTITYDTLTDGIWLLRKDCYTTRAWDSSDNDYANSDIHTYLNSTFLGLFDAGVQDTIATSKIPIKSVNSIMQYVTAKIFLLGAYEVGWTSSTNSYFSTDGYYLSYFNGTATTDSKRIAYLDGAAVNWWLRALYNSGTTKAWAVQTNGGCINAACTSALGIRPAFILPSDTVLLSDGTIKL